MNPETFFDNFGMLADVPDGVSKLRGLILQLAVQGKLVAQDENDEPASVLLEKIRAEKERLVKEGKIKKGRALPLINQEQIPYELPYGWEWVRLGDVGHDCGQKKPDIKFTYIDVSAIDKEHGVILDDVGILEPNEAPSRARKLVSEGSVIYATVRPYLLNIAIIDRQFEPEPIVSTAFAVLHPFSGILNKYLYFYLRSKPFIAYVESEMTGMAYPAINDGKLYKGLVPVPPSNEQKRIVTKVDQLMALCDELEARQQKKQEARLRLNSAALDKLLTAHEPAEFAHHWQRVCDNFDLLYDNPETVGELRKAILQLAVQGKLVRQDENDEPAAVLLGKIKAEKERLVKEGEIRKQKAFPPVKGSDGLFELPESWQWDRFVNVILSSEAGWSPQCEKREREGNEWGVLKVSAVSWDVFKPHENKALPSKLEPRSQHEVKVGDFLISRANTLELVAKSVVVEDSPPKLMMSDKLIRLHLSENVERRFFNIFNNCSTARGYYAKEASGTSSSMRNVSRECILKMPVPVPPVEEQKRIVSRVDQLTTLCDDLEAKLRQSQTDGAKLMEAVVHKLVAA